METLKLSSRARLKQLRHRLRIGLHACVARRLRQPVFVLTTGRSGSNLFVDLCNSLGTARFLGEILHPTSEVGLPAAVCSRRRLVAHLRQSLYSLHVGCAGAKIHFEHLELRDSPLDLLQESFPNARIVLLYRNRVAEQFVSWKLARRSGRWVGRAASDRAAGTICVDPQEFLHYYQTQAGRYGRALHDDWLKSRLLELDYESLAASPQEIFNDRVCPFFGVPARPVQTSMIKQNERSLAEVVENYDEVSSLLERARLADALREIVPGGPARL